MSQSSQYSDLPNSQEQLFPNAGRQVVASLLANVDEMKKVSKQRLKKAKEHIPGAPGTVYQLQMSWRSFCSFRGSLNHDITLAPDGDTICRFFLSLAEETKREGRGHGPDKSRKYSTFLGDMRSLFTILGLKYDDFRLSSREKRQITQTTDFMVNRQHILSRRPVREKQYPTLDDAAYCVEAAFAAVLDKGSSISEWILSSFLVLLLASTGLRAGDFTPGVLYARIYPDFDQLKQFSLLFSDIRVERTSNEYEKNVGSAFLMNVVIRNAKGRKGDPHTVDQINLFTKVGEGFNSRDVVLFFLIYAIRVGACTLNDIADLQPNEALRWKDNMRNMPVLHAGTFSSPKDSCMLATSLSNRVSALARNAGIVAKVTGHDFRRGLIRVTRAKVGLKAASEQVGHRDTATTRRYADSVRISTKDPTEIMDVVGEETAGLRRKHLTDSRLIPDKKKARLSINAMEGKARAAIVPALVDYHDLLAENGLVNYECPLTDIENDVDLNWDEVAHFLPEDGSEEARMVHDTYTDGEHLQASLTLMQVLRGTDEGLLSGTPIQFISRFASLEPLPEAQIPWTMESAMEYQTFFCSLCDERFHHKAYRLQHMGLRHKSDVSYCSLCGVKSRNQKYADAHRRNVHTHKFHCSPCGFESNSDPSMRVHTETRHPVLGALFQCPNCEKTYNNRISLQNHMRDVHLRFACDVGSCNVRFFNEEGRSHHRVTEHNINTPVFGYKAAMVRVCPECKITFKTKGQYRDHHLEAHAKLVIE